MSRIVACLLIVVAVCAGVATSVPARRADESANQANAQQLPGARNEINAGEFPSLQAAIDALPDGGGIVRIPPGEFVINQPLQIHRDDVTLEGAGGSTHIRNETTSGQSAIVASPPDGVDSIWRLRIANLRITGNENSGHGIHANKVDEIFLEGITVSENGGHGVFLDACYEDPRVCDSLFTYNKQTGLALAGCHDIVVAANHFEENQDAVTCMDGFNLCMNGNNLDDHLRHGVVIENTYGSVVAGNMIEECQGTAVVLDRDCYGITVSANVIAHNFGGGVDLRDAHGCAISANTFTIVPKRGLVVGANSGRITISANNFSDSYIGNREKRPVDDQQATGIVIEEGAQDLAITGNVFSGLDTVAVATDGETAPRVTFANNLMRDVKAGNE